MPKQITDNWGKTYQPLKRGTRILVSVIGGADETASVQQWLKSQQGPRENVPAGYEKVKFDNGGTLLIHESGFRVIDNRV